MKKASTIIVFIAAGIVFFLFKSVYYSKTVTSSNSQDYSKLPKERLMNVIKSQRYFIDTVGWEEILKKESEGKIFYSLQKIEEDTGKFLTLLTDKEDLVLGIDSYTKEFFKGEAKHHVSMHEDTFYYYTESFIGEKNFVIGEYNYKFEQGLLGIDELDYYMLYVDSLGKVRGSDLPMLPELSNEEIYRLETLLRTE